MKMQNEEFIFRGSVVLWFCRKRVEHELFH